MGLFPSVFILIMFTFVEQFGKIIQKKGRQRIDKFIYSTRGDKKINYY